MNKNNFQLSYYFIIFFHILSTLFVGIWIFLDSDKPYHYGALPFLPILHGIISFLFYSTYKYETKNLVVLIVSGVYFIRNVVTPFTMSLDGYVNSFPISTEANLIYSIGLMVFDTIVVFLTLHWYYQKKTVSFDRDNISSRRINKKTLIFFIVFVMIFLAYSWINVPELQFHYTNLYAKNSGSLSINLSVMDEVVPRGGVKRVLYTLFLFVFPIYRILLPGYLIYLIRKKVSFTFLAIILSGLLIMVQTFFISKDFSNTFFTILVLFLLLLHLYPRQRRKMTLIAFVGICMVLYIIISNKLNTLSQVNTSVIFQAYFSGVNNVNGIFNIQNSNKLSTLFYDIYSTIPFRNSLFKISNGEKLVEVYGKSNNIRSQIIPSVGQAYHYIGIFAPIVTFFMIRIALKYERLRNNEKNILKFMTYSLIVLYTSSSPVLYNTTIYLKLFLNIMLPMLLFTNYSRLFK